jgi:hypothetical protein
VTVVVVVIVVAVALPVLVAMPMLVALPVLVVPVRSLPLAVVIGVVAVGVALAVVIGVVTVGVALTVAIGVVAPLPVPRAVSASPASRSRGGDLLQRTQRTGGVGRQTVLEEVRERTASVHHTGEGAVERKPGRGSACPLASGECDPSATTAAASAASAATAATATGPGIVSLRRKGPPIAAGR